MAGRVSGSIVPGCWGDCVFGDGLLSRFLERETSFPKNRVFNNAPCVLEALVSLGHSPDLLCWRSETCR
jgi:hypothetical protein